MVSFTLVNKMKTKVCTKCCKRKKLSEFNKDKTKKDGYYSSCKKCNKKRDKEYRQNHKHEIDAYQKEYRQSNKEYFRQNNKEYYQLNKEKLLEYRAKYRENNKEKIKAQQIEYRENNPEKIRNHDLKSNHSITLEEYNKMLEKQNGVCAICGKKETDKISSKKIKNLAVDHNHKTGKVRGLLCGRCNKAIGLFQDNLEHLQSAFKYLNGNV